MTCSVPSAPCSCDAWCDVLPAVQEAYEIGGGDGLDLAAQAADGEAVNARQQAAMAPFRLVRWGSWREAAAQDLTLGFKLRQCRINQRARYGQARSQFGSAIRTAGFKPAAQDFGGAGFFGFGTVAGELDRRC
jgi:hypothetical protein